MLFDKHPLCIQHEANTKGRDLIVGDLHGCRTLLDELLIVAQFDPSRDRLFSVGDLVDRGPHSAECLNFLQEPWFFSVLGNHDAMLLAWIYGKSKDKRQRLYANSFVNNSGWEWASRWTGASEALPHIQSLPFTRLIDGENPFAIVHAERIDALGDSVVMDGPLQRGKSDFADEEHFILGIGDDGDWYDHFLWGRSIMKRESYKNPLQEGFSHTYCGHTIDAEAIKNNTVLRRNQHTFLDHGAYKIAKSPNVGFGLVLWDHQAQQGLKHDGKTISVISGSAQ